MKSCPWCGKEYPDDAMICFIDGKSLLDNESQLFSGEKKPDPLPDKNEPYLTFPDYQWSARDTWKCLGMVLIFEIVLSFVNRALNVQFPDSFSHSKP